MKKRNIASEEENLCENISGKIIFEFILLIYLRKVETSWLDKGSIWSV